MSDVASDVNRHCEKGLPEKTKRHFETFWKLGR